MGLEALIVALIIGAVAGWLAGFVVKGRGFGLIGDIVVGIVGALVANWLFPDSRAEPRRRLVGRHPGIGHRRHPRAHLHQAGAPDLIARRSLAPPGAA